MRVLMKNRLSAPLLIIAAWLGMTVAEGAEFSIIDLGQRRELFVDRFLIDRMDGAQLRLHHPQPAGVALRFDRPWEGIVTGYITVLQDGDRYLMYYHMYSSTRAQRVGRLLHGRTGPQRPARWPALRTAVTASPGHARTWASSR